MWSDGLTVVASLSPCRSIVDLSGVTKYHVSTRAITMLARSNSPELSTRVIVAPRDLVYGTARMFQVLSERTRKNVHVVRTLEQAYKILGIESPTFVPLPKK